MDINTILSRAKIGLIASKNSAFISTIVLNLHTKITEEVPTAAVDGLHLYINPDFFQRLTDTERVFLLAHEGWHVALDHLARRGDKAPQIWNQAGDYVINNMLCKVGMTMPADGLRNPDYDGLTTEDVYDKIYQDPPKQNCSWGLDIVGNGDGSSKGSGNSTSQTQTVEISESAHEQITDLINRAAMQSRMAGQKPGDGSAEFEKLLEELLNPKVSWKDQLQQFVNDRTKDDYSWSRPNRRFQDVIMPSQYSEAVNNVTVAIDTSGSITQPMLQEILSEVKYMYDTIQPNTITILDCDTRIHNIYTEQDIDDIENLKFSGGGGTSFKPVIKYCEKHPPNVLLYFTDLYASPITEDPGYPILWVCYSNHEPAPLGETIYYEPDR